MERTANTLDEAKKLFAESTEPVLCKREGFEDTTANDEAEAEAFYS